MRFFDSRMRQAFPSYSGITWLDGKLATNLLNIMLRSPIQSTFTNPHTGTTTTLQPFWWTRGHADFTIEGVFIEDDKLVINFYEFIIKRIAVCMGRTRFENFIYVETDPDRATQEIYADEDYIQSCIARYGYASEEFGYRPSDRRVITRTEYDNNGYVTESGLERADEFELRGRYLSKFNFIITFSTSYFHSQETNSRIEEFLSFGLKNTVTTQDIEKFMKDVENLRPQQREY